MLFLAALFSIAVDASPAPAPSSSAQPARAFAGVTLGQTARSLVDQRGEPVGGFTIANVALYFYSAGGGIEDVVSVSSGNVTQVSALRVEGSGDSTIAPLGVQLDSPASALDSIAKDRFLSSSDSGQDATRTYRGDDGVEYVFHFKSDKITSIDARLTASAQAALQPSTMPVLHGGTAFDDAIVVKAPDEMTGIQFEHEYLSLHKCGDQGIWKMTRQALLTNAGRHYDVLSAECTRGDPKRDFYFDIENFFGKL